MVELESATKQLGCIQNGISQLPVILILFITFSCTVKQDREIKYHENGQVKFEVPKKRKNWHGEAKGYYPNGKLQGRMTFVDGKREGMAYEYYQSGEVKATTLFSNNIVLREELYHKTGELIERSRL